MPDNPIWTPKMCEKMTVIMVDFFNNVYVDGKNKANEIVPTIVPTRVTTSSKIITYWRTDAINIVVPIIAVELTGMDFDESRSMFPLTLRSESGLQTLTPVPYIFTFNVSIFTKKFGMLAGILEQVLPRFRTMRAYPLREFRFTDGSEIQRDIPVTMKSTGFEIQSEFQKEDVQLYYSNLSFTLGGHLYMSHWNSTLGTMVANKGLSGDVKYIENIDINFENMYSQIYETLSIYEAFPTGAGTGVDPVIYKDIIGYV